MTTSTPQTDPVSRLQVAQWVLDKQLAWIAAADAKVAVVTAIDTAVIAALATAFASSKSLTAWAMLLSSVAMVLLIIALACAALALHPRTRGPQDSLIFFSAITKLRAADYVLAMQTATNESILSDITNQAHRNAEIADAKYRWVRRSVSWSFAAALPWAIAVYLLLLH